MVDIMTDLHQYVPMVSTTQERIISSGATVTEESATFHPIIIGGDQLTAARARSAIKSKMNGHTHSQTLSGLVPAAEDWHAKGNLSAEECHQPYQCWQEATGQFQRMR